MRLTILLAVCALSCSAATKQTAIADAVTLHCQIEVLQPLTVHPELATAAEILDALDRIKHCAAVADAGPAL